MTAGPEGGRFTGTPWEPGSVPTTAEIAATGARPQVETSAALVVSGGLRASFGGVGEPARLIRRITVQATTAVAAYVYVGDVRLENLVSGTRTGNFDENDCVNPIFVPEGSPLVVTWETAVGTARARIEFVELVD